MPLVYFRFQAWPHHNLGNYWGGEKRDQTIAAWVQFLYLEDLSGQQALFCISHLHHMFQVFKVTLNIRLCFIFMHLTPACLSGLTANSANQTLHIAWHVESLQSLQATLQHSNPCLTLQRPNTLSRCIWAQVRAEAGPVDENTLAMLFIMLSRTSTSSASKQNNGNTNGCYP